MVAFKKASCVAEEWSSHFSLVQVPPRVVVDPSEMMVIEMEMVVMVVLVLVLEALDRDIPGPWYPPCRTL